LEEGVSFIITTKDGKKTEGDLWLTNLWR
jgi:hypothetical protein